MTHLSLVALLTLSLAAAGCTAPADPLDGAGLDEETGDAGGRASAAAEDIIPLHFEFDGSMLGVGLRAPGAGASHTGVTSTGHEFIVAPNATSFAIDMQWVANGPHLMGMQFSGPDGPLDWMDATPDEALAAAMTRTVETPTPGEWRLFVAVQGHALDVQYEAALDVVAPEASAAPVF